MFKVGDSVRISDQEHEYCGFYGTVDSVIEDRLWIADSNEPARVIVATESQVEAN